MTPNEEPTTEALLTHPGDCPATLAYGHDTHTRGCVEYEPPRVVALAYLGNPHDHPLWQAVADELDRATSLFGRFNSGHEGWAVIREEVDELWAEVKANRGDGPDARREAIQIAAMALRYIVDVAGTDR